ncbi:MAG TPA: GNAT family N-acetyltransferase [Longimicrobium sp.]
MSATQLARPARPPVAASAEWTLSSLAPPEWTEWLAACGGTFFHAPPVLEVSLPPGEPVYARLVRGSQTLALALGVAARCRLSRRARHYRFAALPAAAPGVDRDRAATRLVRLLARQGAAEVVMESFGARGVAGPGAERVPGRPRIEFLLPLDGGADALLARMRPTHRRHVRHGEAAGWTLRVPRGDDALRLLGSVREGASARAAARGDGFQAGLPAAAFGHAVARTAAWGTATFAAYDGDAALGAVGVGWAGGCAYLLSGGSTPEGYRRSAAHWLAWRVMAELAAAGLVSHNLGGVPEEARSPGHPAYGLYEYKRGYGGEEAPCRGARWEPDPRHLRLHGWLAWMTGGGR